MQEVVTQTPEQSFLPDDVPIKYEPGESSTRRDLAQPTSKADAAFQTMTNSTFAGLSLLRPAIEVAVTTERNKLCMSSHDEKRDVALLKSRVIEENERLKYMNRKLAENVDSHNYACEEYEKARTVCMAAREDDGSLTDPEQVRGRKYFVRMCESLEKSWQQNVDVAKQRRTQWEFKSRRQTSLITKLKAELAEAKASYEAACAKIDSQLADLQAVLDLMKEL